MTGVVRSGDLPRPFGNADKLVILDVDGTLVDAFHAVETAFAQHEMDIGDLERFQKRRKLLKYLGGLREFPKNLRRQFGKQNRKQLIDTLTEVYRSEAQLYPGMAALLAALIKAPDIRVGVVTRNITREPAATLTRLLDRFDIDANALDFLICLPLNEEKLPQFRKIRSRLDINPARRYACGDEYRDYLAAVGAGLHPLMASYGFEDHLRLRDDYQVPDELIARTPPDLAARLRHALDLGM
jgi:phosphoglycolate phosphatase